MLAPLLLAAIPLVAHHWVIDVVPPVVAVVAIQSLEGLQRLLLRWRFYVLLVEYVYLLSHHRYFIHDLLYVCEIHLR